MRTFSDVIICNLSANSSISLTSTSFVIGRLLFNPITNSIEILRFNSIDYGFFRYFLRVSYRLRIYKLFAYPAYNQFNNNMSHAPIHLAIYLLKNCNQFAIKNLEKYFIRLTEVFYLLNYKSY